MPRRPTGSSSPPGAGPLETPYDKVKRAITTGEFSPGRLLVPMELAEWCGVSRTPIRDALGRLEQDGLLKRTDRGLVVRERSPEEILDIYEMRIVLEGMAAKVAAARRTALDVIRMRSRLATLQAVPIDDENRMAEANSAFHRSIWAGSHNEALSDALDRLNVLISARYPTTTLSQPGRWEVANCEHAEIVDAIEAQDMAHAAELAAAHFTTARDLRLKIWASEQGGEDMFQRA